GHFREGPRGFRRSNWGDAAVAVFGDGFYEAGVCDAVAELLAQGADALGQGFLGDRNAAPDFVEEALLRDQLAVLAQQQDERVEVARVQFDQCVAAAQLALRGIELEVFEAVDAVPHAASLPWLRDRRGGGGIIGGGPETPGNPDECIRIPDCRRHRLGGGPYRHRRHRRARRDRVEDRRGAVPRRVRDCFVRAAVLAGHGLRQRRPGAPA